MSRGSVRALGAVAVLAVAGAAGGYGLSSWQTEAPATISVAAPVPAQSPSYPTVPEVTVLPDPGFPPLTRNLDYRSAQLGTDEFPLPVRVPRDWVEVTPTLGEWKWFPQPGPDETKNTYFLRVRTIANVPQTVATALDERIANLSGAEGVSDFQLESRSADTFVATYVAEGHARVAMERFITDGASDNAYAWIAVVGREQDRDGLTSLLESVTR